MTTRSRESPTPGKEKRGISPSNTPTIQRRKSPSTSKPSSPSRTHHDTPSSASEKHIPNYLRPTLSSAPDASKQHAKKPVTTNETKPSLTRRRSFDHPPTSSTPSGTQKLRGSASPTLRSSSFSGKSVASQKGVPDKNLKGSKDVAGKQHSLYARPVSTLKKAGGTSMKKKEATSTVSSSTTKGHLISPPREKVDNHPELPDDVSEPKTKHQESCISESADDVSEPETKSQESCIAEAVDDHVSEPEPETKNRESCIAEAADDHVSQPETKYQESCIAEAEEEREHIGVGNHEKGSEDLVVEDQELVKVEQSEGEGDDKDAKNVTVNSPADAENRDAKVESVDSSTEEEEISSKPEELKEHSVNEMNHIISTDECVAGDDHNDEIEVKKSDEEQQHEEKEEEKEAETATSPNNKETEEEEEDKAEIASNNKEAEKEKEDEAGVVANKKEVEEEKEDEAGIASEKKEVEEEKEDEAAIASDKKEAEASASEAHESKEVEVQQVVVQEKRGPENPAPKVQIMAHGKKEIPVSNDSIEETASKLREQRKNKVKALAGAFESVMQDK